MNTSLQFGNQGRAYLLTSAVLIYADKGDSNNIAATVHDVKHTGKQPMIMPGQPVSVQALERIMSGLGRQTTNGFIPTHIIANGFDRMAWWCPAAKRRIWFKTYDGEDKPVKSLNGKFVHHPPLLFVAQNHGLNVFALPDNERPQRDTTLYRAPYWNLSDGHMCNGDMKLPVCSPDNIPGFEAAFFNSAFTHGRGEGITRHKGGHYGLWAELAARKTKPDWKYWRKNLIRSPKTISQAIK